MTYTTLQYGSVEKTLADWGVTSARREASNQASDTFALDLLAAADAVDPFPFGAKITVRLGRSAAGTAPNPTLPASGLSSFSGGKIFFVGWRVDGVRQASAALEAMRYKFAGPWEFFLERLVFQKLFLTWNGAQQTADYRSQIVLGQSLTALIGATDTVPGSVATSLMSIGQQLREIAAYAIGQTVTEFGSAQFQFDPLVMDGGGAFVLNASLGPHCQIPDYAPGGVGNGLASGQTTVPLRAPLDAVNDITCAEAMRKMLRWIGGVGSPVMWFDYTLDPPALKVSTRDQLPAVTLPAFGGVERLQVMRRDDLVPSAIDLKFRVTSEHDGQSVVQIFHDLACAAGATNEATGVTDPALLPYGRKFAAQVATIDFEGPKVSTAKCTIACLPLNLGNPSTDGGALACWTAIFPELSAVTHLSGGFTSLTDPDSGAAVDFSAFAFILRDPGAASWMFDGSTPGVAQRVVVRGRFSYTEGSGTATPGVVDYHEKTAHLTLTNLPGGTYFSSPSITPGEPVPFGLASFIYNIEKIAPYQGSCTFHEGEITDVCPLGKNLNLTGGAAEWETMNACVQQITYDLDAGSTTLTFGPAAHLGARDLMERLRVNVAPRAVYLIGANQLNEGSSSQDLEIPSQTPQTGRSSGVQNHPHKIFATQANDILSLSSLYPNGFPGITVDSRVSGHLPSTNHLTSTPIATAHNPTPVDNTDLAAPTGPCLFVAKQGNDAGVLGNFIRLAVSDIAPDPADNINRRGVWLQKIYTGEDCTNKSFRWFLCSPLYQDP
ncbi:MAG TPA: hypothetical protein VHB20_04845 [Verrucomicrobiae bacterium]|jgi:hypothetical protein|nr:hypothetical protein [Verrucomicrobiae bacterium]